jgi:hypothetical protein
MMHLMIFIPPYHTRLPFGFLFVLVFGFLDIPRYQWSAIYHVAQREVARILDLPFSFGQDLRVEMVEADMTR